MSRFEETPIGYLGFHRLAIMGLDERGMQPFHLDGDAVICNGELYGFRPLRDRLLAKYELQSYSDCEILLPLYHGMMSGRSSSPPVTPLASGLCIMADWQTANGPSPVSPRT